VVVKTGIFVDAPVEGLSFVSGSQTGVTDAAGTFRFEAGTSVKFMVGNIVLGTAPAKALMTPLDLVKAVDATAVLADARVTQITQFLMTVNSSATAAKMTIPAAVVAAASNATAVDLSQAPVADMAALLTPLTTHVLVTVAAATAHLQATTTPPTAAQLTGTFAGFDSATAPQMGLMLTLKPNLAGDAFDVTGTAAQFGGSTWSIAGTMTTAGVLTATGTGTGATPPANMTITGAMTPAAAQITASASLSPTALPVPVLLDKAAAPAAAAKFALATDPGVTILAPPTQIQHIAADLSILADGTVNGHIVEGEATGLPLATSQGGRYATLTGVITSAGTVIAMGGLPGTSETFLSRSATPAPSVVLMTGTVNANGTVSATVKSSILTTPGLTIPPLTFVTATNPLVGVYVGTHTEPKPVDPLVTSYAPTVALGVNNDGSVHGYSRFFKGLPKQPESDLLIDGVVSAAGVLGVPAGFNVGLLGGLLNPGLAGTNDDGAPIPALGTGTFAGTIAAGASTGNWQLLPAPVVTGSFTTTLLP
jgi:hypothetical protein